MRKTRKNIDKKGFLKKATAKGCREKTCRARLYKSIYGSSGGGQIRAPRRLFM